VTTQASCFGIYWSIGLSGPHLECLAMFLLSRRPPLTMWNRFDILGHKVEAVGDKVAPCAGIDERGCNMRSITGIAAT